MQRSSDFVGVLAIETQSCAPRCASMPDADPIGLVIDPPYREHVLRATLRYAVRSTFGEERMGARCRCW
jgi:hypothetical protein